MLNKVFNPFPTLTSERLILHKLTTNHEEAIFALRSNNEVNKYLDRPICNSVEEARNFILMVNENIDKKNALYWAITLTNKNTLVGTICLFGFSDEKNKCEIGYELLPSYQAQGIMKEAVQMVIQYAFNTLKVQQIDALVHKNNQRSIKLLDRFSISNPTETDVSNPEFICYHLFITSNLF